MDLAIDRVATEVGLESRSHFSHIFADYYGVPPAVYPSGGAGSG